MFEHRPFSTSTALHRAIRETNPWPQLDGIEGWILVTAGLESGIIDLLGKCSASNTSRPELGCLLDPRRLLIYTAWGSMQESVCVTPKRPRARVEVHSPLGLLHDSSAARL